VWCKLIQSRENAGDQKSSYNGPCDDGGEKESLSQFTSDVGGGEGGPFGVAIRSVSGASSISATPPPDSPRTTLRNRRGVRATGGSAGQIHRAISMRRIYTLSHALANEGSPKRVPCALCGTHARTNKNYRCGDVGRIRRRTRYAPITVLEDWVHSDPDRRGTSSLGLPAFRARTPSVGSPSFADTAGVCVCPARSSYLPTPERLEAQEAVADVDLADTQQVALG
jgi:hypothetical protein